MAIPGTRPDLPVRAKVRIGEKRKAANGKEYPAATDHFVSEDPSFLLIAGDNPKQLRIVLPFAKPEENFSTGLEYWRGKQLTYYSKGEGDPPLAYRVESEVKDWDTVRGEKMGRDRIPVTCRVRDCVFLKDKACKPMGRLQFFLAGDARDKGVYQIDTKSWNTIEKIEPFLTMIGDPRERVLLLSVEMVQKGRDKYPVISLEVEPVEVNTPEDAKLADALIALDKAVQADAAPDMDDMRTKLALTALLDITNAGWRQNPDFVQRIKDVGATAAAKKMLERLA